MHITNTPHHGARRRCLARAANVHIENSQIEGDGGAIDASEGCADLRGGVDFKGLNRRLENSAFHDLGGNVWN